MNISGVCHIHSRYSYDAKLSLAELRDAFVSRGISFALMTEHTDHLTEEAARQFREECVQYSDDTFMFIPGFEVPYLGTHVLVVGARAYHEGESTMKLLTRWHGEGALLVVAHPHRNRYRMDDFLRRHVDGVEIWNSQYDGIHAPRASAWHMAQDISGAHAYGSLDLHRIGHINGPRLVVQAGALTTQDIVGALRAGAFTIQRGPVKITSGGVLVAGGALRVRCMSVLMPAVMGLLRVGSSVLAKIGLRRFGMKRWIRERI